MIRVNTAQNYKKFNPSSAPGSNPSILNKSSIYNLSSFALSSIRAESVVAFLNENRTI
jgi:hypothetical protein